MYYSTTIVTVKKSNLKKHNSQKGNLLLSQTNLPFPPLDANDFPPFPTLGVTPLIFYDLAQ